MVTPVWRTKKNNYWYVDGNFGSDIYGSGTQVSPWRTLEKAWQAGSRSIICRGPVFGTIIGDHSRFIRADYYGAAYYDGEGENILMWLADLTYMIIANAGNNLEVNTSLIDYAADKHAKFAGVGRAGDADSVDDALHAFGLASSPCLLHNSKIFRGCIGGISAIRQIYSHPRGTLTCPVTESSYNNSNSNTKQHCTIHHCRYDEGERARRASCASFNNPWSLRCLYTEFDIFLQDVNTYTECFFAADVRFIVQYNNKYYAIKVGDFSQPKSVTYTTDLTSPNSVRQCYWVVVDGVSNIRDAIDYLGSTLASGISFNTSFNDCVFSTYYAQDIYNNHEALDYTLKIDSPAIDSIGGYYGALPPAVSLKFLQDSSQKLYCFDSRTVTGCLSVKNNQLVVSASSVTKSGSILSKVFVVNTDDFTFDNIYALSQSHKAAGISLSKQQVFSSSKILQNTDIPQGTYLIVGQADNKIQYNSTILEAGEILTVSQDNTTFEDVVGINSLVEILNPNHLDSVYIRARSANSTFIIVLSGNTLTKGSTYLNETDKTINVVDKTDTSVVYRTILSGESFVAEHDNSTYYPADGSSTILSIKEMFPSSDDSWVPAQLWGQYFVSKDSSGVITTTSDGVPESSGNYKSWSNTNSPSVSGTVTTLNQKYIQIGIFVQKI